MEPTESVAEIRRLVESGSDMAQMREAMRKMCDLLERLTKDVSFLKEGEEAEMVSYRQ